MINLSGTPQRATESDYHSASEITDTLVQFDLKFDSLRTFLESTTKVVNQHASLLNKIQIDVNTRMLHEIVA